MRLLTSILFLLFVQYLSAQEVAYFVTNNNNDNSELIVKKADELNFQPGTFKDSRDGKTYKTVKVGTQVWMAENLAFKANEGCWAYENKPEYAAKYGYLYNWETAKKSCPSGYHLPSDEEWVALTDNLKGDKVAGKKLKATFGWSISKAGSGNGTNEVGFSALPGGFQGHGKKGFQFLGYFGYWWTSSLYNKESAWTISLSYKNEEVGRAGNYFPRGNSVRCVKD